MARKNPRQNFVQNISHNNISCSNPPLMGIPTRLGTQVRHPHSELGIPINVGRAIQIIFVPEDDDLTT